MDDAHFSDSSPHLQVIWLAARWLLGLALLVLTVMAISWAWHRAQ